MYIIYQLVAFSYLVHIWSIIHQVAFFMYRLNRHVKKPCLSVKCCNDPIYEWGRFTETVGAEMLQTDAGRSGLLSVKKTRSSPVTFRRFRPSFILVERRSTTPLYFLVYQGVELYAVPVPP